MARRYLFIFLLGVALSVSGQLLAQSQGPSSAQIQAAIRGLLTNNQTVTGTWTFSTAPGGVPGTPGGSNTQVQFNNSSAFGGSANFVWNGTNVLLGSSTGLSWSTGTPAFLFTPAGDGALLSNHEVRSRVSASEASWGCNPASDPTTRCIASDIQTDAFNRFYLTTNGNLVWGPGTAGQDTILARTAANTLTVTNNLIGLSVLSATNAFTLNGDLTGGSGQLAISGGNTFQDFIGTLNVRSLSGGTTTRLTISSTGTTTLSGPLVLSGALATGLLINTTGTGVLSIYGGSTCTNQVLTVLNASGAGTCTTLTSAYVNNTIALTGTDINTSNQVTATHLAAALPVAQGGTSLQTLTAHALYVGNGTSAPNALAVCGTGSFVYGQTGADPICSTMTLPNAASTGTHLIATGSNAIAAVTPALNHAKPANQTARSSSGAFVMMGLGAAAAPCTITPVATGRVVFVITGNIVNNTTITTVTIQMAEGTGSAPANNASAQGTVISSAVVADGLTSDLTTPFAITSIQTGLALSTAVWFDLQLQTSSTNTGQPTSVDCTAYEL